MCCFAVNVLAGIFHILGVDAALLHVEKRGSRYIIADKSGRERMLHGINLATLGEHGGDGSIVPIDVALYRNGGCPENNNKWYNVQGLPWGPFFI